MRVSRETRLSKSKQKNYNLQLNRILKSEFTIINIFPLGKKKKENKANTSVLPFYLLTFEITGNVFTKKQFDLG